MRDPSHSGDLSTKTGQLQFLDRIMRGEQLDLTGVTLDSFEKLFSRIAEAVGNHRSENEVAAGTE